MFYELCPAIAALPHVNSHISFFPELAVWVRCRKVKEMQEQN